MVLKYLLSLVLYKVGDWISYPMVKFDLDFLYPLYSKLMMWSWDLDTEKRIWKDGDSIVTDR